MKRSTAKGWLTFIFVAVLLILFCSFGPGHIFVRSLFDADNFSPTWKDDIKTLLQTGGILLLMVGAPAIIVLVIFGIGSFGSALSEAVLGEEEKKPRKKRKK